jgi:lipid-A-disaccharide synthase
MPLLDPASPERAAMLAGYGRLSHELGEPGVTDRAAIAILDQLQASSFPAVPSAL